MFEFLKRFFGYKTTDTKQKLIEEAIKTLDECIDSIEQFQSNQEALENFTPIVKEFPERKVAEVQMSEVFPRLTIKEFRDLGIDVPKDIDDRCIMYLSNEAMQDALMYGERLSAPNSLGPITDEEIEQWSDGDEILDKIDVADAYSRVYFEEQDYLPYQDDEYSPFWVPTETDV